MKIRFSESRKKLGTQIEKSQKNIKISRFFSGSRTEPNRNRTAPEPNRTEPLVSCLRAFSMPRWVYCPKRCNPRPPASTAETAIPGDAGARKQNLDTKGAYTLHIVARFLSDVLHFACTKKTGFCVKTRMIDFLSSW